MSRRLGIAPLLPVLWFTVLSVPAAADPFEMRIAGHEVVVQGFQEEGEIFLHLAPFFSYLGTQVQFEAKAGSLTLLRGPRPTVRLKAGSMEARVGDETRLLAQPPRIIDGRSYLPVYSLARLLGLYVRRDDSGVLVINPAVTRIDVVKVPLAAAPTGETNQPPPETSPVRAPNTSPPTAPSSSPGPAFPGGRIVPPPGSPSDLSRPAAGPGPVPQFLPAPTEIRVAPPVSPAAPPPPTPIPAPGMAPPDGHKLVIEAGAPVSFAVKTLADPFRVYIDLQPANLIGGSGNRYEGSGDLRAVRASQFSYNPDVVRVVAEFASPVPYRVDARSPASHLEIALNATARPAVRLLQVGLRELSPHVSRVTFTCDGFAAYTQSVLRDPNRVVLDFVDTDAAAVVVPPLSDHRLVSAIRVANMPEPPGTARAVIELKQMTAMTVGRVSAKCIAVDLVTSPLSKKIVVVDPGHGGSDPGAQYRKKNEKDLVLDLAKRLHALLIKNRVTALLTRSDDTFVPLSARCEFANKAGADLFISVHLNASPRPNQLSGTEVYYYNDRSLPFAISVHDHLVHALGLKDGGVRKRMLYVVHHTTMPAVLTETCYLNNDNGYKLITQPAFRQRVAEALYGAIKEYVEGPTDTPGSTMSARSPAAPPGVQVSTALAVRGGGK